MHNLLTNTKQCPLKNYQSAATGAVTSDTLDTAGYDSVMFLTKLGALTTNTVVTVKIQQGAESDMSDAADLEGTSLAPEDTDDNLLVVHDVNRPQERYLRVVVARGTANAVIDSIVAILYNSHAGPVSQTTGCVAESEHFLTPIEGTA